MREGGCFCGFVRYRAGGKPFDSTSCHCTICRRTSGAPYVAWFSVKPADFQWLTGEPASFRSSDHATRTFCPRCGTPLTFVSTQAPQVVDVSTCSLDAPEAVPPADHTFVSARLPWVHLDDGLPAFPAKRT